MSKGKQHEAEASPVALRAPSEAPASSALVGTARPEGDCSLRPLGYVTRDRPRS